MTDSRRLHGGALVALLALAAAGATAARGPVGTEPGSPEAGRPLVQSFDLAVPQPPTPVTVDGAETLVYELHVTNFARGDLTITALEVLEADRTGRPVGAFEGAALSSLLGGPGVEGEGAARRVLAPGSRAVAYFWLPLDPGRPAPEALMHRITFRPAPAADGPGNVVEGGRVRVGQGPSPALGPPLRGGPWLAAYHPGIERGHRRVLLALEGRVHIPARFTIDWFKLDERGSRTRGDRSRVASWYGYGADVLAVADATVVAVRSSMAESATVEHVDHGLEKESGNFVTLDLGDGRYVHYEHLKPGSVRVQAGDRVREGEVVAQVGNTGNTSGPHLHMHVSDGAASLGGEGVPWELRDFQLLGSLALERFLASSAEGDGWTPVPAGTSRERSMERPGPFAVVELPE